MEPVGPFISEGNSIYFELLEGLAGCYREPTGAVESSIRKPKSCMENSNTAVAGDPNEGSGLVNRCF